jgi:formamidopyrimidine-DNA glycosylase
VPELPEVERLRRSLRRAMTGARFERVVLNRGDLRKPFPSGFARRLRRQTVRTLTRRGKYLLAELSSGDTLIMHLGMSGWFRVESTGRVKRLRDDREAQLEHRHDHVLFTMSSGKTVIFNDPRRFGVMELVSAAGLPAHASVGQLGPEPLSRAFDARALASRCANRRVALKVALLDQRIAAGIGNIYASEALHLAKLSPLRQASSIATTAGAPLRSAERLTAAIKSVLRRAVSLKQSNDYRGSRFRVYDREGERCPTPGCRGTIARIGQAGRSTFYCPVCQR